MSFVTTEQAPIIESRPIVTPGMTNALAPINTFSSIVIFPVAKGKCG